MAQDIAEPWVSAYPTPGTFEPSLGFPAISLVPGQFLLKDIVLLAVSLWIYGDSARRLRRA